jgi:hypothetical protein
VPWILFPVLSASVELLGLACQHWFASFCIPICVFSPYIPPFVRMDDLIGHKLINQWESHRNLLCDTSNDGSVLCVASLDPDLGRSHSALSSCWLTIINLLEHVIAVLIKEDLLDTRAGVI